MLYTNDFHPNNWIFHVAPVLLIGGEWIVFEKANGINLPLNLNDWMKSINSGKSCEFHDVVPTLLTNGDAQFLDMMQGRYPEIALYL